MLNACFWAPALLARDAATADLRGDGRLAPGVGAGTVRDEFTQAGLPLQPARERMANMAQAVLDVRRRLADEAASRAGSPRLA